MPLDAAQLAALQAVAAGTVTRKSMMRGAPMYRVRGFFGNLDQAPFEFLAAEAYITLEEEPAVLLTGRGTFYLESLS